jgi:hypothetical protein
MYKTVYVNFVVLHKYLTVSLIAGATVVKKEGREIIVEFNASVKGHYYEPGYVHFRKLAGGNNQTADCW